VEDIRQLLASDKNHGKGSSPMSSGGRWHDPSRRPLEGSSSSEIRGKRIVRSQGLSRHEESANGGWRQQRQKLLTIGEKVDEKGSFSRTGCFYRQRREVGGRWDSCISDSGCR
jgi:hypothetical protein